MCSCIWGRGKERSAPKFNAHSPLQALPHHYCELACNPDFMRGSGRPPDEVRTERINRAALVQFEVLTRPLIGGSGNEMLTPLVTVQRQRRVSPFGGRTHRLFIEGPNLDHDACMTSHCDVFPRRWAAETSPIDVLRAFQASSRLNNRAGPSRTAWTLRALRPACLAPTPRDQKFIHR